MPDSGYIPSSSLGAKALANQAVTDATAVSNAISDAQAASSTVDLSAVSTALTTLMGVLTPLTGLVIDADDVLKPGRGFDEGAAASAPKSGGSAMRGSEK